MGLILYSLNQQRVLPFNTLTSYSKPGQKQDSKLQCASPIFIIINIYKCWVPVPRFILIHVGVKEIKYCQRKEVLQSLNEM